MNRLSIVTMAVLVLFFAGFDALGQEKTVNDESRAAKLAEREQLQKRIAELRASQALEAAVESANTKLQIEVELFGKISEEVALTVESIAGMRHRLGQNEKVLPAFEEAYRIRTELDGADYWKTVNARTNVEAISSSIAYSDQEREQLGKAWQLNQQRQEFLDDGDYEQAAKAGSQAVAIRRAILGSQHRDTADSLFSLAWVHDLDINYDKAIPLYEEAIAIRTKSIGLLHPDTADAICNLADVYRSQGHYEKARSLFQQSLEIREATLGAESVSVSDSLNFLGLTNMTLENYAEARQQFRRALQIRKQLLGEQSPQYGTSLHNLGLLYDNMGDSAKAGPMFERSLEIDLAVFGEMHRNTAISLATLGSHYSENGDIEKAFEYHRRAMNIRRQLFGTLHPEYAHSINAMADLHGDREEWELAESLLAISVKINRRINGDEHPNTADALESLAVAKLRRNDFQNAETAIRECLSIRDKVFGRDHTSYAIALMFYADVLFSQGKLEEAEESYRQSFEIRRRAIDNYAIDQSSRQQLLAAHMQRHTLYDYLSLAVVDDAFVGRAYDIVLAWKGATLQRQSELQRMAENENTAPLFKKLQDVSRELASVALSIPDEDEREAWQERVSALNDQKESMEIELSRVSNDSQGIVFKTEFDQKLLQASLPKNAVVIDFIEYERYTPPSGYDDELVAFVSSAGRPAQIVNFGDSSVIEEQVNAWRAGFGNTAEAKMAAERLSEQIWKPLQSLIEDQELLLISPDGFLGKFPFAVLPIDEGGTHLFERYKTVMVPVPRLIPSMMSNEKKQNLDASLLVMGNVEYDATLKPFSDEQGRHRSINPTVRGGMQFSRLAATAIEVNEIRKIFADKFEAGQIVLLEKEDATEQSFRELAPNCRTLHLATHGFFLDAGTRSSAGRALNKLPTDLSAGFFSGLAFAGANGLVDSNRDDGILTAEEVVSINLENVDLAVLSACETGLGEVSGAEGLLGLQRSFQVAGASSTITSLWKVEDKATQILMQRFYVNYWTEKMSKLDALREAQLWMLKNPDKVWSAETYAALRGDARRRPVTDQTAKRLSPEFWAAFSLSGDWR